jgi:phosphate transport system ATP-binding protein
MATSTTLGEVMVLGKNIYDEDVSITQLRRRVGMVFQRPNPMPISIYENVLFGAKVHTHWTAMNRSGRDEDGRARRCAKSICGMW